MADAGLPINETVSVTSRHQQVCCIVNTCVTKFNRKKVLADDPFATPLQRCLSTLDICFLGVGHMLGAGVYILTGHVSKTIAGPSIVLSYAIAGITSLLAALCYAEFASRVPTAGSAYVYTYVTLGELWAFIIGWCLVMGEMFGAATVSSGWSGYVDALFHGQISNGTKKHIGKIDIPGLNETPDILAFGFCIFLSIILLFDVKSSAKMNSMLTGANLFLLTFIVAVGAYYASTENWSKVPFFPFGIRGMIEGAAKCFFAFIGFESMASASEEAKNPNRSIPTATFLAMFITTAAYMTMSMILTLLVRYDQINEDSAFPDAFSQTELPWIRYVVSFGALVGMTTCTIGNFYSLSRCVYAMASDGLLFSIFAKVHPKSLTPIIAYLICGVISGVIALFIRLESLVDLVSISMLMVYTIVNVSVIILRYKPNKGAEFLDQGGCLKPSMKTRFCNEFSPGVMTTFATVFLVLMLVSLCLVIHYAADELQNLVWWSITLTLIFVCGIISSFIIFFMHQQSNLRLNFQVPWVPLLPTFSTAFNIFLLINLNGYTWLKFLVWTILGVLIYFCYGIRHSKMSHPDEQNQMTNSS